MFCWASLTVARRAEPLADALLRAREQRHRDAVKDARPTPIQLVDGLPSPDKGRGSTRRDVGDEQDEAHGDRLLRAAFRCLGVRPRAGEQPDDDEARRATRPGCRGRSRSSAIEPAAIPAARAIANSTRCQALPPQASSARAGRGAPARRARAWGASQREAALVAASLVGAGSVFAAQPRAVAAGSLTSTSSSSARPRSVSE